MARNIDRPPSGKMPEETSSARDVADFLKTARALAPERAGNGGRLLFALDATMSRQPTWDMALRLQADMFREAQALGGLQIKLIYYRGLAECRTSGWTSDGDHLAKLMSRIACVGGHTQIGRVLGEARRQAGAGGVKALVFVGDAMEENPDALCQVAGELGMLGLPVFMFQEGDDPVAGRTFADIAHLSGGAHCRFDPGAAAQLRDLLRAAAAFASGGRDALKRIAGEGGAGQLLAQLR